MNHFSYKNIQMRSVIKVIIASCLLKITFGASLFGIDFSEPKEAVKTGIQEISQMLKLNIQEQTNPPLSFNNQSSDRNTKEKENLTQVVENFKDKTKMPPKINELSLDYNQISDSLIPIKKDPYDSEKEPGLLNLNKTDQNTGVSELVTDAPTLDCSETGTDYTTETSEFETTTICESLNRIGGVPPNVVASLLG